MTTRVRSIKTSGLAGSRYVPLDLAISGVIRTRRDRRRPLIARCDWTAPSSVIRQDPGRLAWFTARLPLPAYAAGQRRPGGPDCRVGKEVPASGRTARRHRSGILSRVKVMRETAADFPASRSHAASRHVGGPTHADRMISLRPPSCCGPRHDITQQSSIRGPFAVPALRRRSGQLRRPDSIARWNERDALKKLNALIAIS